MELPFETDELKSAWDEWLLERKDRKLKKYTDWGMKAVTAHLLEISGHNEQVAIEIIKQSITQGWQGLFELKNKQNGSIQNNSAGIGRTVTNESL